MVRLPERLWFVAAFAICLVAMSERQVADGRSHQLITTLAQAVGVVLLCAIPAWLLKLSGVTKIVQHRWTFVLACVAAFVLSR